MALPPMRISCNGARLLQLDYLRPTPVRALLHTSTLIVLWRSWDRWVQPHKQASTHNTNKCSKHCRRRPRGLAHSASPVFGLLINNLPVLKGVVTCVAAGAQEASERCCCACGEGNPSHKAGANSGSAAIYSR
eukprot:1149106-Pelagomonas_calceolata.AAC.5